MTTSAGTAERHERAFDASDSGGLRVAGWGGVLAAVCLVTAFLVLPADDGGTTARDIAARYADGGTGYLRAAALEFMSLGLTALLAAGLCVLVGQMAGRVATWTTAMGATTMIGCQLAGYAVVVTLALRTAESADLDVVVALYDLSAVLFHVSNVGLALMTAAVSVGLLHGGRHRMLTGWSLLTAAAAVAGALALAPEGFFSPHGNGGFLVILLQLIWTLAAGIALIRVRSARARSSKA